MDEGKKKKGRKLHSRRGWKKWEVGEGEVKEDGREVKSK